MEENIQIESNVGKKPRMAETDDTGDDIISKLPESIISRILSLLPTKHVLKTCVLSKEWEYKWASIYNIDIIDEEGFSHRTTRKNIVNFVDRIFILSRASTLKRFRLWFVEKYDAHRMITWISAALVRDVEDLTIFYGHEGVVLPRCLFDCIPLRKLWLHMPCTFRPVQNWVSNLEVLYLDQVIILNDHAPNTSQLIFNFPVLGTLELRDCKWLKVNFVEINAPALTEFNVAHYRDLSEVENCQIKISGAKLLKFGFHGYFVDNLDLSASSVFSAAVDYQYFVHNLQGFQKNGSLACLLLKGCSGLNHLQLSGDTVEAIIAQSKQGHPLPEFNMLKRLEICSQCNIEAFLEFLRLTSSIEWIKLSMLQWTDYDYDLVESMPCCIVSHIKEVEFDGFNGEQTHVHLADFLLKNAAELKKMVGLSRRRSEEKEVESLFWEKLKRAFANGDLEVDSSVKNMADFESLFG
ncbi:F-box/LRR-repeat protein At4g14103-like isoform X1 [Primulina eburnea]|uniref:F-box/LRR-repeat protein At4g14103-like isoform X1 n=1 Tax=Primulina eburnea TaxID=1245227 RepID=UPI003C6C55F0